MPQPEIIHSRKIVYCDVYDADTGKRKGKRHEFTVPLKEWTMPVCPTVDDVLGFLAAEPELQSAGLDKTVVQKVRPGLNKNQRLGAVLGELRILHAAQGWAKRRKVKDADERAAKVQVDDGAGGGGGHGHAAGRGGGG